MARRVFTSVIATCMISTVVSYPGSLACGMWGCDPLGSYTFSSAVPTSTPALRWRVPLAPISCQDNATSAGCVSTGANAVCALPLECDAETSYGLVAIDSNSHILYNYTGAGSSRCTNALSVGPAFNLPIVDVAGDVFAWDLHNVIRLQGGKAAWIAPVDPTAACPTRISQVSLTNASTLVFYIAEIYTVFTYVGNGVPIASLRLRANDSGTHVFPPPPPNDMFTASHEGADFNRSDDVSRLDATQLEQVAADGAMVPIAPTAVDGGRIMFVSRYYATNFTGDIIKEGARAHVYLCAVDQRTQAVGRLWWQWQLLLPLVGTPLADCIPTVENQEILHVAGPMVGDNGTAVLALSCNGFTRVMGIDTLAPSIMWVKDSVTAVEDGIAQLIGVPTPADAPTAVWLLSNTTGQLTQLEIATGVVLRSTSLSGILLAANGTICGLPYVVTVAPTTYLVLSSASMFGIVGAAITDSSTGSLLGYFALGLDMSNSTTPTAWCVPVPPMSSLISHVPFTGQPVVVSDPVTSAPSIVFAGAAEVFALG